MALLENALKYVAQGLPVFPLCYPDNNGNCGCGRNHQGRDIGKVPLTPNGLTDATIEADRVRRYWTRSNANIGIAIPPGFLVLDVDIDHNGFESLGQLQNDHGFDLAPTWLVTTGSGGQHYWYKTDKPIRNTTRLAGYEGLDIRGLGGYVVVPPSLHRSGHYYETSPVWDGPITEAPQKLTQLCNTRQAIAFSPGETITEGVRNDTLARDAGAMRRRGLSEKAIYAALQVTNQERCQPPLAEDEVKIIAKSIGRYTPEASTSRKRQGISFD